MVQAAQTRATLPCLLDGRGEAPCAGHQAVHHMSVNRGIADCWSQQPSMLRCPNLPATPFSMCPEHSACAQRPTMPLPAAIIVAAAIAALALLTLQPHCQ